MKKISGAISELIETFAISLVIFLGIYTFLAFPEVVVGASMEPTLHTGERLLVERITVRANKLKRGDIIIFNPPGNNSIDYVKRIVGLPGETIKFDNCNINLVYANGSFQTLEEKYLYDGICTKGIGDNTITVPGDSFFVLGDNREQSADSRFFGALSKNRVVGKVILRFWPPNKLSAF